MLVQNVRQFFWSGGFAYRWSTIGKCLRAACKAGLYWFLHPQLGWALVFQSNTIFFALTLYIKGYPSTTRTNYFTERTNSLTFPLSWDLKSREFFFLSSLFRRTETQGNNTRKHHVVNPKLRLLSGNLKSNPENGNPQNGKNGLHMLWRKMMKNKKKY